MARNFLIKDGKKYFIKNNKDVVNEITSAITYRGKIGWTTRLIYDNNKHTICIVNDAKDKNGVWCDNISDYHDYTIEDKNDYTEIIRSIQSGPLQYARGPNDMVFPPIQGIYGYGSPPLLNPYNDPQTKPGFSITPIYDRNNIILPRQHGKDYFIEPSNWRPSETDKRSSLNFVKKILY